MLRTTTTGGGSSLATSARTASTARTSAWPWSSIGVPTQMRTISAVVFEVWSRTVRAPEARAALERLLDALLGERDAAQAQCGESIAVGLDQFDAMAHPRQADGADETDVPGPDDGDRAPRGVTFRHRANGSRSRANGRPCYHSAPMADRARYYLTTSIAYANNKPGLHTLYEVIGADAIARWHRMLGDDTRFLTGTDEHSINIAQAAVDEGRPTREFVDEKVAIFKSAEDALAITPDRFIRTTDPDHVERRPGDGPPGLRQRRHLPRHVRGLVLPERGLPQRVGRPRDAARDDLPEPPRRPAPVADRAELVLPAVGLPGAARTPLRRPPGFRPARLPAQRDARLHPRRARGLLDQPRADPGDWGIPFPIAENGETALREDGSWDPEAGKIYVWFDALINYITGAGFPDDPEAFAHWWPADLHIIGKDIVRFHSIFWPAMLWSAGLEPPRQVWVHGFLIAAGGEQMSKSRGNFFDPDDFVAAFGSDGARYVVLREVPFDRDAEVSWDSFVRRYNADLANDFGNLVNRTVSMANRYLDGERPAPRDRPGNRPSA